MKCRVTSTPIDQVEARCIILGYYEDERPLKGMTGLADWRLCGFLSRQILESFIDGHFGETIMFPVRNKRLKTGRVIMMGLGPKKQFNFETFSVSVRKALDTLFKLHINDFAIELPGIVGTELDLTLAANRFCEAMALRYRDDKNLYKNLTITVVSPADQLKTLNPIFAAFEKKARDELGLT